MKFVGFLYNLETSQLLSPLSSVAWCCLASSFFGSWCSATPHDGLVVGLLGGWVACWGVRWFGVACWVVCWAVGVGVGVWLLGVGWSRGRVAFGVTSVWIGVGVASMFSCLGSNNGENDTDHLKVQRMLLLRFFFF